MVRIFTKDDCTVTDLIQYASDHIYAAERLFATSPSFYDSAGYLMHVGVELLLKAWLLQAFGEFKGIHELSQLYDKLKTHELAPTLDKNQRQILSLLNGYKELRYPQKKAPVEIGTNDLPKVRQFAEFIWEAMGNKMPREIREEIARLDGRRKGGRPLMKRIINAREDV